MYTFPKFRKAEQMDVKSSRPNLGTAVFTGLLFSSLLFVSVVAEAANKKPVANPGKVQTVDEQTAVSLDGSASTDADGKIASYKWEQTSGNTVNLSGANSSQARFTAPAVKKATSLGFKLTVTDNSNESSSKTVTVKVNSVNKLPLANASAVPFVVHGNQVVLDGSASRDPDADGKIAKYQWVQTSGTTKLKLTNPNTATASFTAPAVDDTLVFTLKVTDDENGSTTSSPVSVAVVAQLPFSATLTLDANKITKGGVVSATAVGKGGKPPYTYSINWGDNSTASTSATATHNYSQVGTYTVTLTATDSEATSKTVTQTLTVDPEPLSAKFDLNGSTPTILVGDTLKVRAYEISGGTAPYSVKVDWGDATTIENFPLATGIVSNVASHRYANLGNPGLKVTVSDKNGLTKSYNIALDVQAANPLGQCQ